MEICLRLGGVVFGGLVVLLWCAGLVGCGVREGVPERGVAVQAEAKALTDLVEERLALAEKVAWVKFREGLPVEDRVREEEFLTRVETMAGERGYPVAAARRFFAAQIEASKREQRRLLSGWDRGQPLPDWGALSLRADVRPQLDALTPALLDAWAASFDAPGLRWQVYRLLREAGRSPAVARAAAGF
jgi:chorismate mutase